MTTNEAPTVGMIAALRAAGHTARQIAAAARVHVSTVYRWARGLFRPTAARAAALAALANRKDTTVHVPVGVNAINGKPVVYGAADLIAAALNHAAPITITSERAAGDIVWAGNIAREFTHPKFGPVAYAYIDLTRLKQAPQVVALDAARATRGRISAMNTERAAAAMVPSCDNCGDCAKCC